MAQVRLDDETTADVDRYRGDEESRAAFVNGLLRDVFAGWERPTQPTKRYRSIRVRPTPRPFR